MVGTIDEAPELRRTIQEFLSERFTGKTEKLAPDDPKYEQLVGQFDYDRWLADAARRVGQLQVVTHSLKPIHPDAKGSSVYSPPEGALPGAVIGTNILGDQFTVDVVGNAAALDVFKFLKLEYDGRTLSGARRTRRCRLGARAQRRRGDGPPAYGPVRNDYRTRRPIRIAYAGQTIVLVGR